MYYTIEPGWTVSSFTDDDQLNKESVFEYLRYNRDVLERYMMEEVDQDTLERWTICKAKLIKQETIRKKCVAVLSSLNNNTCKSGATYMFSASSVI